MEAMQIYECKYITWHCNAECMEAMQLRMQMHHSTWKMRRHKRIYKLWCVLHFNTQVYAYETKWPSTKSRKIEWQSYLMYIKTYLKQHKSEYRWSLCKTDGSYANKATSFSHQTLQIQACISCIPVHRDRFKKISYQLQPLLSVIDRKVIQLQNASSHTDIQTMTCITF